MSGNYAEHKARIDPIVRNIERIAYRLRQGAISETTAAEGLRLLADKLAPNINNEGTTTS